MTTGTQVFKNIVQRQIFNCKKIVKSEISNCKITEEPTMATPEEAARNECIQAEVAELVKRYVPGSRSERFQVRTLALALIQKKTKN